MFRETMLMEAEESIGVEVVCLYTDKLCPLCASINALGLGNEPSKR